MADGYVRVPPDNTGKKIDTEELTTTAGTVERQRVAIPDEVQVAGDDLAAMLIEQRVQNLILQQGFGITGANPDDLRDAVSGEVLSVDFIDLRDVPDDYTGYAGYHVQVNSDEDGLEFALVREVLTADTTYYVATTGSDTTGTGTVGNPYRTPQKAFDVLCSSYDVAGYTATIKIAAGTYTASAVTLLQFPAFTRTTVLEIQRAWTGGGLVVVEGDATTPSNVVFDVSNDAVGIDFSVNPGNILIRGIKFTGTGGSGSAKGIWVNNDGIGVILDKLEFGAINGIGIAVAFQSVAITFSTTITISGNMAAFVFTELEGQVDFEQTTFTFSGTPAFVSAFTTSSFNATQYWLGNTYTGSATGSRFQLIVGSVLRVTDGSFAYLPIATLPGSTVGTFDQTSTYNDITGGRNVLSADRSYYVRTDGSDSNDGLANSAGRAFLTIGKAVATAGSLDANGWNIQINVAAGTYNESITLVDYSGNTGASLNGMNTGVHITGDTTTPTNVVVNCGTSQQCFITGGTKPWLLEGMQFTGSAAANTIGVVAINDGILFLGNVDFGTVGDAHIWVTSQGVLTTTVGYSISGSTGTFSNGAHLLATVGGTGRLLKPDYTSMTVTLSGTPAFPAGFISCQTASAVESFGVTFSGAATGPRYNAIVNGAIQTYGGGATYFPGNSAGTTASGGQYA